MRNAVLELPSWLLVVNGLFVLGYVGLIAVVMSYAALQVEFAQSVRSDEAAVATLEGSYLAQISHITATDYAAAGYAKPLAEVFVPGSSRSALLTR